MKCWLLLRNEGKRIRRLRTFFFCFHLQNKKNECERMKKSNRNGFWYFERLEYCHIDLRYERYGIPFMIRSLAFCSFHLIEKIG